MKFTLSKLLFAIAAIGVILAGIISVRDRPKAPRDFKSSPPEIVLAHRHFDHEYRFERAGELHTIYVVSPNFIFDVAPRLQWNFTLANRDYKYRFDNLSLGWNKKRLSVDNFVHSSNEHGPMVGRPYFVEKFDNCYIENHWHLEQLDNNRVLQTLHLYLIEYDGSRLLEKQTVKILVDLEIDENRKVTIQK